MNKQLTFFLLFLMLNLSSCIYIKNERNIDMSPYHKNVFSIYYLNNGVDEYLNKINASYIYISLKKSDFNINNIKIYAGGEYITTIKNNNGYLEFPNIFGKQKYVEYMSYKEREPKIIEFKLPIYTEQYDYFKNKKFSKIKVLLETKNNNFEYNENINIINNKEQDFAYAKTKFINGLYNIHINNKNLNNLDVYVLYNDKNGSNTKVYKVSDKEIDIKVPMSYPVYYASVVVKSDSNNLFTVYKRVDMDKSDPFFGDVLFKDKFFENFNKKNN